MLKVKPKKCRKCGEVFTPTYSTAQVCCSPGCAMAYSKAKDVKIVAKEWSKEKKERKEAIMSHSEWLKILQAVFNAYIRERDKGRECVSCGCKVDKGHASHMFSVGSHPNMRFNEDNVHLSCIECNLHKHGFLIGYMLRLPDRIGKERFDKLIEDSKKTVLKLSIPEIKEMIQKYKLLTKQLKNENT